MPDRFQPVSGIIELVDAWRPPSTSVLRAPAKYEPTMSRKVIHETIHYWQYISEGFLTLLAEEEWNRLRAFEDSNDKKWPGPIRQMFIQESGEYGLSPQDLHEAVARYWEFMSQGPERLFSQTKRSTELDSFSDLGLSESGEAFELAMQQLGGGYAHTYQILNSAYGPLTPALFSLICHFSLQTMQPVEFFDRFLKAVLKNYRIKTEPLILDELWESAYLDIRSICVRTIQKQGEKGLLLGGAIIKNGELRNHPVYRWSFDWMNIVSNLLVGTDVFNTLKSQLPSTQDQLIGILLLDRALASPVSPNNRSLLIEWLAPPCILFSDGMTWNLGELHRRELVREIDDQENWLSEERRKAGEDCVDLRKRWANFIRELKGY